jgi:hypothetical protein
MLPAPATMAAPPRRNSSGSCSPAVPPPPVAGAPTGTGLDGARLDGGSWLADGDADVLAVGVGVAGRVVLLTVVEWLTAGENEGGVAADEGEEQAATEAEARMAKVAQLAAVSLALSLVSAPVMCIFTGPPHAFLEW